MHYAPYIVVRLSFDQYASVYKLLDAHARLNRFDCFELQSIVLLDYLHKDADRQFNALLNRKRDYKKLYAVKFSQPVALALFDWMRTVHLDAWQQQARTQIFQILVNYGLVKLDDSY
ncbi:hypothetical protein [Spirosoma pomorum]